MKIEVRITTDAGIETSMIITASAKAYAYIQNVLTNAMTEILREEANGLPHASKKS